MNNLTQLSPFDSIRRQDEQGEYWLARELMPFLEYVKWQRFQEAVDRAKISCEVAKSLPKDHFEFLPGSVKSPNGGRPGDDYKLSRYACHLIAMNGDVRKEAIAQAQAYFSAKIREAETVIPAQDAEIEKLRLQLAIAQAQNSTVLTQERLMLTSKAIADIHGYERLAFIQGRPNAVITEKEVIRETVMVDQNLNPVATFDGMGISEISKRLGFTGKNATKQCRKWLESVGIKEGDWYQEMTAHASAKLPREMMPRLKQLWAQRKGDRQMLLGE